MDAVTYGLSAAIRELINIHDGDGRDSQVNLRIFDRKPDIAYRISDFDFRTCTGLAYAAFAIEPALQKVAVGLDFRSHSAGLVTVGVSLKPVQIDQLRERMPHTIRLVTRSMGMAPAFTEPAALSAV
jgi:hypothetical protein